MSNKKRIKKTINHTHSYGKGADKMLGMLKDYAANWDKVQKQLVDKHNEMAAQLAAVEQLVNNVAKFSAGEFGKMQAKLNFWFQSVDAALHHHDVNHLAASEIMKEIFGQLTQVDFYLKKAFGFTISGAPEESDKWFSLDSEEVEKIKTEATEWFDSVLASAFKTANESVNRQRQEADEARKKEQEERAAAMQKEADDKSEAARMEAELQNAEKQDRGVAPASGSSEQENLGLPPEVRVFGMT